MNTAIQIGLWTIVFLVFAIFLSLNIFYIKNLIKNRQEKKLRNNNDTAKSIVQQERQKMKAEIISDLERRLEAL